MSRNRFKALLIEREDGIVRARLRKLVDADLPAGEVLVAVRYSSLNYKDGMAITGKGRIVASYPHVPGVDFSGCVLASENAEFKPGDEVVLTGWGVGERHWGGLAQRARVQAEWLVPLPRGLDLRKAMTIGSAGLTAMLCVMALEEAGVLPDSGTVVVTGAAGGVGSMAVALLAQLGYRVAAVTGRNSSHAFLRQLGAAEFLGREEMSRPPRKLESRRWAGCVDVVGGVMLARILAEMNYGGTVAATGLAGDDSLSTSMMPFILRNVCLRGVESVTPPRALRERAWRRLAELLPEQAYQAIGQEIPLAEVAAAAERIMRGEIRGRVLVDLEK
ncbi:MAG: oxidoreductase [Gammaproteobacteria bacterium]|nr:oxidoreductase [Gammaproteobacteria bacterium]